jgi:hypothetical protein
MANHVVDEDDMRELELYVENTGELYPDKKRIIALMVHRITSDRYKRADAAKLWRRWLDKGAVMYRREIGSSPRFTAALKDKLALELAEEYEGRIRRHEEW